MSFLDTVYPSSKINKIGQVGGVDAMPNGDLLVFQRGGRIWTYEYIIYFKLDFKF